MRYFEISPGNATSLGSHPWEHEIFIVKGKGIVKGSAEEHTLTAGDAVYIPPPNEYHQFINNDKVTFRFICVIPKGYER